MSRVVAVNGGPRKNFNTAALLQSAVDGAKSAGAGAEMFHLYDYQYKGCVSCFACKRLANPHRGRCAMADELSPILRTCMEADVLLLGSPIYMGDVTGMMRSFLERLIFAISSYDELGATVFEGHISSAFFFTMNMPEAVAPRHAGDLIQNNVQRLARLGKPPRWMASYETYQFDDYSKYATGMFDVAARERIRAGQFPADCKKAFVLGTELVSCP